MEGLLCAKRGTGRVEMHAWILTSRNLPFRAGNSWNETRQNVRAPMQTQIWAVVRGSADHCGEMKLELCLKMDIPQRDKIRSVRGTPCQRTVKVTEAQTEQPGNLQSFSKAMEQSGR